MSNAAAQDSLRRLVQRWQKRPDRYTNVLNDHISTSDTLLPGSRLTEEVPGLSSPKILGHVLHHLAYPEIAKLRSVSRRLCHLIDQPAVQYELESRLSGVSFGPAAQSLSLEERINVVNAWRAAWRKPPWQGQRIAISSIYQDPAEATTLVGSVYADINPDDSDGFAFLRLPSASTGLPERRWAIEALPDWTEQYTFDYSQDLFVLPHLVKGKDELLLRFFSCTTGKAHPAASQSAVRLNTVTLDDDSWSLRVAVCGELVGLAVFLDDGEDTSTELWVLNWKTGGLQLNIYHDPGDTFALRSFAFLDEHHVLLLINESYSMPNVVVVDSAKDHVSSARTNAEAALDTFASLVLGLPYLSEDALTDTITLECNPHPRQPIDGALFTQTAPPVVLVAYRDLVGDYNPERTFDLLVPARVITSRIYDPLAASRKSLLWQEWCAECRQVDGPERAALFPLSRVCGSRYVTVEEGDAEREVCLYDFDDIFALRRDVVLGDAVVEVEPTVVDSPYEQGEPTVKLSTAAPYRKVRTGVLVEDDAEILIAENGIVIRRSDDRENYANLYIYTI